MADDTLTARNRINQRNFRARRQNYIKDLEERLRKYESEGVQATIEIQAAARQVTEQNVKLRALLISRYGMNDHEIESYLSTHGPPVSIHSGLLPVALTIPPTSKPLSDVNAFHLTTQLGSDNDQSMSPASVLDPALGLASLHRAPEQFTTNEHPAKKQRRDIDTHMSISALTSFADGQNGQNGTGYYSPSPNQDRVMNEQDPDTLSESSNPRTPGDTLDPLLRSSLNHNGAQQLDGSADSKAELSSAENGFHSNGSSTTSALPPPFVPMPTKSSTQAGISGTTQKSNTAKRSAPIDETACEDAARIIASMRGTNDRPEQILLELGCSSPNQGPTETCKVKNLSIFSLMDRG